MDLENFFIRRVTACEVGKYNAHVGAHACMACAADEYTADVGATSAGECMACQEAAGATCVSDNCNGPCDDGNDDETFDDMCNAGTCGGTACQEAAGATCGADSCAGPCDDADDTTFDDMCIAKTCAGTASKFKIELVYTFAALTEGDLPNVQQDIATSLGLSVRQVKVEIVARRRRAGVKVKATILVADQSRLDEAQKALDTNPVKFTETEAANPDAKVEGSPDVMVTDAEGKTVSSADALFPFMAGCLLAILM